MTPAQAQMSSITSSEAGLRLRLAQRAFAALLEKADSDVGGIFHAAQLRSAARRTLSALSADDQARFSRWLGLQLATGTLGEPAATRALARVDRTLAAGVAVASVRLREEWRLSASATAA